jgi:hypothetical protein
MKTVQRRVTTPVRFCHSDAVLSTDGVYRYLLTRQWAVGRRVLWVMLNPSTADARVNDPTITRCIDFSKQWGFARLDVVNLFAFRATDPKELAFAKDPVGSTNDWYIEEASAKADLTVVAWGAHAMAEDRAVAVLELLKDPHHLGTTKSGAPRHPLYLRKDTAPQRMEYGRETAPYCKCSRGQQDGWSNLNQPPGVWVHPKCGLPSKACA